MDDAISIVNLTSGIVDIRCAARSLLLHMQHVSRVLSEGAAYAQTRPGSKSTFEGAACALLGPQSGPVSKL